MDKKYWTSDGKQRKPKGHQMYEKKLNFTGYQTSTDENNIKIRFYEISSNL